MPFTLPAGCLFTAEELSKFVFGVDDLSTNLTVPLTSQNIFSISLLSEIIAKQIKSFIDSDIIAASYTEVWDGAASDEIVTRERPLISVDTIKFAVGNNFASATGIDPSNYAVDRYSIKFLGGVRTPIGRSLIQVVYTAGYTVIPKDITFAALMQFQWAYRQIGKGDSFVGVKQISKMHESQTKDDALGAFALREEVCGILKQYQRFEAPLSVMFTRVS
jgi:hypothetical protein